MSTNLGCLNNKHIYSGAIILTINSGNSKKSYSRGSCVAMLSVLTMVFQNIHKIKFCNKQGLKPVLSELLVLSFKHCQRHNRPKALSTLTHSNFQTVQFKAEASTSIEIFDNFSLVLFGNGRENLRVTLTIPCLTT